MEVDNIESVEVDSPLTFDDFKKKVYIVFYFLLETIMRQIGVSIHIQKSTIIVQDKIL